MEIKPVLKEIELNKIIFSDVFNMRDSLASRKVNSLSGQAKSKLKPRDYEDINSLGKSIGEFGLLQNIIVRETKNGHFVVIAGHRRLNALKKERKIHSVSALVYPADVPDYIALEIALTENIQRKTISKSVFGNFVIEYVVLYMNHNNVLGPTDKVAKEDVIKALWVIHDRMFPGGISKVISIPDFLEKFLDVVDTVIRQLLEGLGIDYYTFISDIFPLITSEDIREEYEKRGITLNEVRFLAKFASQEEREKLVEEDKQKKLLQDKREKERLKQLEDERNKERLEEVKHGDANNNVIKLEEAPSTQEVPLQGSLSKISLVLAGKDDKEGIQEANIETEQKGKEQTAGGETDETGNISDGLSSVLSRSYSESNVEKLKKDFIGKFTQDDYDKREFVKHQAEKLGVKRDDLAASRNDLGSILEKADSNEKKKNILDDFIEKSYPDAEPTNKEVLTQKELFLNEDMSEFDKLSVEGKAIMADNVASQCSDFSKNKYSREVDGILSVAKAEAISQVIHEINKVISVSKDDDTLKLIRSEGEIGLKNQAKLRTLAKYYKALGEEIEKRYLNAPDDKRGNLIDALEVMWVLAFLRMNRELKNETV